MIRPKRDAVVIVLGLLLAACQEGSDLADAKRTPKPPPPETTALPEVSITVEIDGKPASPIDAARLAMVTPDFAEEDRRMWKLSTLLGDVAGPGSVVAVSGREGPEVVLRVPAKADEPQPALLASRRGEVVATMVSPQEPFPGYHGRGGRLGRSGDSIPRIVGVRYIRVTHEPKGP